MNIKVAALTVSEKSSNIRCLISDSNIICLGKSSCLIYSMVQWSWYSQWENARVMHRGEEYNTLKTRVGHRMWERAQEIYPKIKGKVIIKLTGRQLF